MLGLGTGQAADLAVPLDRDELIVYGPRLYDKRRHPTGDGGVGPEAGPGHGTRHPDPGPIRRPWVHNWQFTAGEILFEDAEFSDGCIDFSGASFTGSTVNFGEHHLPSIYRTVPPAHFSGGTVDFSQAADFTQPPHFGLQTLPPGLRLPSGTNISDLP